MRIFLIISTAITFFSAIFFFAGENRTDFLYKEFKQAVLWPGEKSSYRFIEDNLEINDEDFPFLDELVSVFRENEKYSIIKNVTRGYGDNHTAFIFRDFEKGIIQNNGYFVPFFNSFYYSEHRKKILEENDKCLILLAGNENGEFVHSSLLLRTGLNDREVSKCLNLYFLKLNGFENTFYKDVDNFIYFDRTKNEFTLNDKAKFYLSLLTKYSPDISENKTEILKELEQLTDADTVSQQ